jgi:L-ascorbate metabolism protein UlaG (beta-lactamase superfamily)
VEITLLRHATLRVRFRGFVFLVDPMLGEAGTAPPVQNSPNPRPNPLVPLPWPAARAVEAVDAVLVTHTHRDHFDDAAASLAPQGRPLFCQPEDEAKLRGVGFADVRPVRDRVDWEGIAIHRTGGRHGTGEIGRRMAPVSGFVLEASGERPLYIAGDTIWCDEVAAALRRYAPGVAVVNAGGARFLEGDPITMTAEDVLQVARCAPLCAVAAVHMEAINHCGVTRADVAAAAARAGLAERVWIPADGDSRTFCPA